MNNLVPMIGTVSDVCPLYVHHTGKSLLLPEATVSFQGSLYLQTFTAPTPSHSLNRGKEGEGERVVRTRYHQGFLRCHITAHPYLCHLDNGVFVVVVAMQGALYRTDFRLTSSLACLHSADTAMCSPNRSLTDLARPSFRKKWLPTGSHFEGLVSNAVLGSCGILRGGVEPEIVGHQKRDFKGYTLVSGS